MNSKDFDQLLRKKLNGHSVTPDPKVWDAIQHQVQSSGRRHYLWWGAFAVLILGAAAYFLWPKASETATYPENTSTSEVLKESPQATPNTKNMTASAQLIEESRTTTSQLAPSKSNALAALAEEENEVQKERYAASKGSQPPGLSTSSPKRQSSLASPQGDDERDSPTGNTLATVDHKSIKEKAIENTQKKSSSNNQLLSGATENSEYSSASIGSGSKSKMQKLNTQEQEQDNNLLREENERRAATSPLWNALSEEASAVAASDELYSNQGFKGFQKEAFLKLERRQKEALQGHDLCDMLFPSLEDCPEFGDRRRRYQVDAYTQTGVLFSHLTNNFSSEEISTYLGQRRSTETPLWHIGFGVRLSTQWTNGISMRGGLQISQSKIRVDYVDETQRQTTVNVSIDTLIDDQGNTTVVWDTISIIETGVEDRRHYNTFTQIDIPLTVGYTFLGPRYDVEINGGVMFNLLFQRDGSVFGAEDNFYALGASNPPAGQQPYDQKLGLSIIGSVALNYHMSQQFSLFVEPQLRYFLDPVSPGDYALHESWFIGSLMVGGRYSF
jgi:hypothetical protein